MDTYTNDWLQRINEDNKYEDYGSEYPLGLLTGESRLALWNVCGRLKVWKLGIPAQACRLAEKYIYNKYMAHKSGDFQELRVNMFLRMVTCAQLAAKNTSAYNLMRTYNIYELLKNELVHNNITVEDLLESEFEVFRWLNFQIPLWSTLEICEYLCSQVGYPERAQQIVAYVLDSAEMCRDSLFVTNKKSPGDNTNPQKNVRPKNIHFAAAVVIVSTVYLDMEVGNPADKLAILTETTRPYLIDIAKKISNLFVRKYNISTATLI